MGFVFDIATLAGGLFVGMLVLLETGRRLGLRRLAQDSEAAQAGFGVVEGAIFALMGLLIAFTFSGAASRFDTRRQLEPGTCRLPGGPQATTMLLLPALNAMIDITTTRSVATQIHPPLVIFAMLCVLALASSLLAGYSIAGGQPSSCWIHMLAFAVIMAVTVYVILDLEYPRLGLIRVDAVDQVLVDLRDSMR